MGMGRGFKWRGVLLGLTAGLALVVFVRCIIGTVIVADEPGCHGGGL